MKRLLFGLMFILGASNASAFELLFPINGVARDSEGALLEGDSSFVFRLYDTPLGGTPLATEALEIDVEGGAFLHYFGSIETVDAATLGAAERLFVGVEIEADGEAAPRLQIGVVAQAMFAEECREANTLGGLAASDFQRPVTTQCDPGLAVQTLLADGTVECVSLAGGAGDITGVTPGDGLSGGGDVGDVTLSIDDTVVQRRVSQVCGADTFMTGVEADGSVVCNGLAAISAVAAGDGIVVDNSQPVAPAVSIDDTVVQRRVSTQCGVGTFITAVNLDGTAVCSRPTEVESRLDALESIPAVVETGLVAVANNGTPTSILSVTLPPGVHRLDGLIRFRREAGVDTMRDVQAVWSQSSNAVAGFPATVTRLGGPQGAAFRITYNQDHHLSDVRNGLAPLLVDVSANSTLFLLGVVEATGTWQAEASVIRTPVP